METTSIAFLIVHFEAWTCTRMSKSEYMVLFGLYPYRNSELVLPIRLFKFPFCKTQHFRQMVDKPI